MIIYPHINELISKVDCRFTLVVETAKRARQLIAGDASLIESKSQKPGSVAVEEIYADKLTYERLREGIK